MSTRCAFISSSPSSNTANSPMGPAPMMRTSVLIGSAMSDPYLSLMGFFADGGRECLACSPRQGKRRKRRDEWSAPDGSSGVGWRQLGLPLRRPHREPVKFLAHLDLARQPRIRLHIVGEVEHVLFHRRRLADLRAPVLLDVHAAG